MSLVLLVFPATLWWNLQKNATSSKILKVSALTFPSTSYPPNSPRLTLSAPTSVLPPVPSPSPHFSIRFPPKRSTSKIYFALILWTLPQQAAGCHLECHITTTIHHALKKKSILTPSTHNPLFHLYSWHHHSSRGFTTNCSLHLL